MLRLLQGNPCYAYCKEIHVTLTARKSMLLLLQGNPCYSYCKEIHVTLTARKSTLLLLQGKSRTEQGVAAVPCNFDNCML